MIIRTKKEERAINDFYVFVKRQNCYKNGIEEKQAV